MKYFRLDKCRLPSIDIKENYWISTCMSGITGKKEINQFIFDTLEVFI